MKRILLLGLFSIITFMVSAQITGKVVDANTNEEIIGASVVIKGTTTGTITDIDGMFKINDNDAGDAVLVISFLGYETMEVSYDRESASMDMGTISLDPSSLGMDEVVVTGVMDIVRDRKTPVAVSTINLDEIQSKAVGNVEFPEVMKNTPSVYVSNQTGFGDSQMFMRGFNQQNTAFLLNGQPINGMEDGRMYWSNWSGMSDVANAVQIQRGLGSSKLAISSVGGTVNIVTRTIENQKGGFARVMYGNDNYLKGTVSYNTGLMDNGLAVSFLLDHWQADNKWADGTPGMGQNYFLSVGYQPSENHTLNFLVTGAPQTHGQRWSQSEETLEETPKFNQHWGEYNGEFLSERTNFYHKPVINLSWDWNINEKSSLSSVLYASFGRGGGTGPYGGADRVRTDDGINDFDGWAQQNIDMTGADNIGSFSDSRFLRSSMNNHQWYGNVTSFETLLANDLTASVGADFRFYTGDHFRQVYDFLGLEGYYDNFRHATRPDDYVVDQSFSINPWSTLFNFASEEQRIAYDYSEDINYQGVFGQLEYAPDNLSVFVQAAVSNQSYQREGRWADIGTSDKVNKIGYNVKGGASYTLSNSHTVFGNAGYYSRQPFLDNIFEDIRYSNKLIEPDVENEGVTGLELGYKYFNQNFSLNVNAYQTVWGNRTNTRVFENDNGTPDDESDDFFQRNIERGIEQNHRGVELDAKYIVGDLTIRAFGQVGDWKYTQIETVTFFNDDTGELIGEEPGFDASEVHVPNAPQTSFGVGLLYQMDNGFSINIDGNYYDRIFRRDNFNSSDPILREDIGQLDPYFLLDAGAGYRFALQGNQFLQLRANVYNALNEKYLNQTDAFGVLNGNGLTWNVSLKYGF